MSLTREVAERLIAITSVDCKVTNVLLDIDGNTCAVGAIAQAAGVPIMPGQGVLTHHQKWLVEQEFPGLNEVALHAIMCANDIEGYPRLYEDVLTPRRRRVEAVIWGLVE